MLAFTLPDSGAESPGMGARWAQHPSWELVDAASEVCGVDVAHLLIDADEVELSVLEHAHLATLVLSLVAVDAAERLGLAPMAVSGYGLGEYTALVAAGSLGFEDGVHLVVERAAAVREALAASQTAAVEVLGLRDGDVESACARAEGEVWVAGYVSTGRVVVAGAVEDVRRAIDVARTMGAAGTVEMRARGGLHTPLLASVREPLRKSLADVAFQAPDPVLVANVDARRHADPAEWPGLLSAQLCAPVRWHQSVRTLFDEGVRTFLEFGAGSTLAEATRSALPAMAAQAYSIASPDDLESLFDRLIQTPSLRRRAAADHAHLSSRLVVSPAAGQFTPVPEIAHAAPRLLGMSSADESATSEMRVEVGDLIGWVGVEEVRAAFSGTLGGLLVITGERVMPSQPVAWLHAIDESWSPAA